jgi:hypothetical protein
MKENELRIGNWIKYEGNEIQLTKQKFKLSVFTLGLDELHEPIPLTEEWLIKFGLEDKEFKGTYHFVFFDEPLQIYKSYGIWRIMFYRINRIKDLRYVHQLQNLYFALTGTELKVK